MVGRTVAYEPRLRKALRDSAEAAAYLTAALVSMSKAAAALGRSLRFKLAA